MYAAAVPETWSLINERDIIPHIAKFLGAYKRPGQRIIVDRSGSIIVRPSPLEIHVRPQAGKMCAAPGCPACKRATPGVIDSHIMSPAGTPHMLNLQLNLDGRCIVSP